MDHKCQLSYKDIYGGDDTTALFLHLEILCSLAFVDHPDSQTMPPSTSSVIQMCWPVHFDRAKISLEFREFAVDLEVTFVTSKNHDALAFWMAIQKM